MNLTPQRWDWPMVKQGDTFPAEIMTETDSDTPSSSDLVAVNIRMKLPGSDVAYIRVSSASSGVTINTGTAGSWGGDAAFGYSTGNTFGTIDNAGSVTVADGAVSGLRVWETVRTSSELTTNEDITTAHATFHFGTGITGTPLELSEGSEVTFNGDVLVKHTEPITNLLMYKSCDPLLL